MSVESAIQQLKDTVAKEIAARDARLAAAAGEIERAKVMAARIADALTELSDLRAGVSGYVLRVGRPHAVTAELHVSETHSGHISVAFRGSRFGKTLPDEHWELLDPTAAAPDQGEPWDRILIKFCERVDAMVRV